MKQTYVAGIRASGKLHLGNYLGLVTQLLESQKEPERERYYFIADLHGLTTPFVPSELRANTLEIVASYLALGVDPEKTTLFLQNHVAEHPYLAWIFNCITPLAELERMTQYKDKSKQHEKSINAGLLTYPCLMAADILLYKPTHIPVGEDQVQHVELARVVARKFNNQFGETFPEPQTYLQKPLRIMSLSDPTKKMSKTGDEALLLDDSPQEIIRKIRKAVTATDGAGAAPGVDNLLSLLAHFGTAEEVGHFHDERTAGTIKFSELKDALAVRVSEHFAQFREKKAELMARPEHIAEVLGDGAHRARKVASATLAEVKEKIGLL